MEIKRYARDGDCQEYKPPVPLRHRLMQRLPVPQQLFGVVDIDLSGFPLADKGSRHITTAVDRLAGFPVAPPMMPYIWRMRYLIMSFRECSVPRIIHFDRGTELQSEGLERLSEGLCTQQRFRNSGTSSRQC
jgi:hypothetical protein